ncbi:MAG: outer membrane beta-barrel protein [Bacteroidales bacterium]
MLKKLGAILFLIITSISILQAQYRRPIILNDPDYDVSKPLRFGFSLGFNIMDLDVNNSNKTEIAEDGTEFQYFADVTHINPGINVNAICDLRLTENIHLRFLPGYAFGQRNLDYYKVESDKTTLETTMTLESSFIELPLSIKYLSQRSSNIRPYLIFGGNYRIDLAAYKRLKVEKGVLVRLEKTDLYYEVGFGIDFFLNYFKFSTEIKWSAGLFNAMSNDYAEGAENYRYAIDKMQSRMIVIAFHFE